MTEPTDEQIDRAAAEFYSTLNDCALIYWTTIDYKERNDYRAAMRAALKVGNIGQKIGQT
jgi:hypothetical protein